jgi:hypothetical protein
MNIDKDIEIVRDLGNEYYVVDKNRTKISFKESQAIENVLEELETKIGQTHLLSEEVYCLNLKIDEKDNEILDRDKEILDLRKELEKYKKAYELETYERQKFIEELETWKKIAEKLAELCVCGCEPRLYEKEGLIDWARKEVEK